MRLALSAGLIVSSVILASCHSRAVHIEPNGPALASRWTATLATPPGLAGALQIRGTAWMGYKEKDSTQTQAHLSIENASPGARYPWHVHIGQCGRDQGIFGPADKYPVLKVGGDGRADADAFLPVPLPREGQYFANVHASSTNMGTIVACGNFAPPVR
jgi:hypothetical protein